jgi:hypothetical protein
MTQEERRAFVAEHHLGPYERIVQEGDARFGGQVLLNTSRPECSPLLLGPLPKAAGGWGTCRDSFTGTDDPDYQALLTWMQQRKKEHEQTPQFGTPQFRPNRQYIREMKRFGVLPASFDPTRDPIDVFETDQRYWELFWYQPQSPARWPYLKRVAQLDAAPDSQ